MAADGFFFGVALGQFVGGLARFFLGLAAGGGNPFDFQAGIFYGAMARVFLGALARFVFVNARIGQRGAAACLFLLR